MNDKKTIDFRNKDLPIAVVLAAGKGTRMNSDLPKVLCPVLGRPILEYVLTALRKSGLRRFLVVIGYQGKKIREAFADWPEVEFVEQTQQLGTGHAVMACEEKLQDHTGAVLVVTGDSPLLQADSIQTLFNHYDQSLAACVMGSLLKDDPSGLGRIVRDSKGEFTKIVEEKDATDDQKKINEVNMSTYIFEGPKLLSSLKKLTNNNKQGEYYVTDCPGNLLAEGEKVEALAVLKPCEAMSINTANDLLEVELFIRSTQKKG
ncbi:MAG: NTP transferase domain-containing protein [Pirellulaceae bacterium]|nr:NTP transferase domain-containing protein [Pirellulaceae bacterium]